MAFEWPWRHRKHQLAAAELREWEERYAKWKERCERLKPNDYGLGPLASTELAFDLEDARWRGQLKYLREKAGECKR